MAPVHVTMPRLMGILNATPDSFSDGGECLSVEAAVARAEAMVRDGAAFIDVGGESTRPGAEPVPAEEELRRVLPVVRELAARKLGVPVSIDTTKPEVARACLEAGAAVLNDISALADPAMAVLARDHRATVVLMHRQGDPRTMQNNPVYGDVVGEVKEFLKTRAEYALSRGIARDRIWLDPGIGFGKTTEHNLAILGNLAAFGELGYPVLIGVSRKSFIGRILGGEGSPLPPSDRAEGSLAAHLWAAAQGAHILRVHDVRATARALALWRAITSA